MEKGQRNFAMRPTAEKQLLVVSAFLSGTPVKTLVNERSSRNFLLRKVM